MTARVHLNHGGHQPGICKLDVGMDRSRPASLPLLTLHLILICLRHNTALYPSSPSDSFYSVPSSLLACLALSSSLSISLFFFFYLTPYRTTISFLVSCLSCPSIIFMERHFLISLRHHIIVNCLLCNISTPLIPLYCSCCPAFLLFILLIFSFAFFISSLRTTLNLILATSAFTVDDDFFLY